MWEKEALGVLEHFWKWICISLRWDTQHSPDLQALCLWEMPADSLEIQWNPFLEGKKCPPIFGGLVRVEASTKPAGMLLHTELLSRLPITPHVMWWYIWITYCATKGLGAMILRWVLYNTHQKEKRCYGFSLYFLPRKPMQVLLVITYTHTLTYNTLCYLCVYICMF